MGCPIFAKLPTPLSDFVLFCLTPPSPPKIGHHLCTFPKSCGRSAGKAMQLLQSAKVLCGFETEMCSVPLFVDLLLKVS